MGILPPPPPPDLIAANCERMLARDIFDQEEAWIAEGGKLTFSEWRGRLRRGADWNRALDDFYSMDF